MPACGARTEIPDPDGPVRVVSLGHESSWALLDDGSLWSWGDALPEPGGSVFAQPVPARVAAPEAIVSVAAGYFFVCALLQGGALWCWGDDNYGQSGAPPVFQGNWAIASPAAVAAGMSSVSSGESAACGVRADGMALCWGAGAQGEVGNLVQPGFAEVTPTAVGGIEGVTAIATKLFLTCAVIADGGVRCWGDGLLGDGGPPQISAAPVAVTGLLGPATGIAVGFDYACALLRDATVACWGNGAEGRLGLGPSVTSAPSATVVPGLWDVAEIACGQKHCCALRRDGTAACWGTYLDGLVTTAWSPAEVPGLAEASAIAAGWNHDCALVRGWLRCWGDNWEGELGDGTTTQSAAPVDVQGML
jgi:alpha-tubulin suppressor-like RCC1 family protein